MKAAIGHAQLLYQFEGSGDSGYMRSMSWQALSAGFIAHRFHMRTCGGTGHLCKTLYHGGLTSDLRSFVTQLRAERARLPVFLIGFSLGGNVALKFAGEEGETDLIDGVCAISTPIDLAACARRLGEPDNSLYERRFVDRMKQRLISTGRYSKAELAGCSTLWEIDDRVTAPSFGFEGAAHYYGTQSAQNFLADIRVPTLLIQAKDDSFIPSLGFSVIRPLLRIRTLRCSRPNMAAIWDSSQNVRRVSGLTRRRWNLSALICQLL